MATADEGTLETWYEDSIGEPSTSDEVYGYWMFALGILAGFLGIALVVLSSGAGTAVRGAGITLAATGLVILLVGQIIRLPLEQRATMLSIGGAAVSMVGVGWFVVAFNAGNWGSAFAHSEPLIMGLYGAGILVMAVGSVVTPLVTGPREEQKAAEARAGEAEAERDAARAEVRRHERQDERQAATVAESREGQMAAETRADEAEVERDAAMETVARHERDDERQAAVVTESRAEQTAAESRAGEAEAKRDAAMTEITRLAAESDEQMDSQSQFELFTDKGGEVRWRLRHSNGNIIADSAEGYSSRQSAIQGLDAVKRDAAGATMLDLDKREAESDEQEDESGGAESDEQEDESGEFRWRLRHDNGNIIADSAEGYSSRQKAMQGLDAVKRDAAEATVLDLDQQ